jgi:hypothetical protein
MSRDSSLRFALTICLAFALGAMPLEGHHSFAMFDQSEQLSLSGTVTRFEWTNPHAYIEIDVPSEGGEVTHWSVELGSPSILMRSGWTFSSLREGDSISVLLSPLRNGDPGGLLEYATLPDGETLGNGPGRGPAPNADSQ